MQRKNFYAHNNEKTSVFRIGLQETLRLISTGQLAVVKQNTDANQAPGPANQVEDSQTSDAMPRLVPYEQYRNTLRDQLLSTQANEHRETLKLVQSKCTVEVR